MATQTWIAERDKLMASNPSLSLIDATKQARGMTTSTTPVAPVTTPAPTTSPSVPTSPTPAPVPTATPTATPTTTQPTPTPTISTAKAGDTVVGVNGEVFTQANNQDFSTTPTETPKVVSATPMSKADEIKAKNEAQLAINQQKAQQAQAERDKATAEQNKVLSNNSLAILNTLKTGGVVPEEVKTSPNYKIALDTYNKIQKYSTYSVNDIATALNQGAILPGTTVYNEMLKDPVMKQKLTDAQVFRNNTPVDSNKVFENASSDILANNPTTARMLDDGIITAEEYAQATNTAEVVAAAKQKEEKAIKYNTLKAEFDAIADEVEAQFPGGAYNDAIIADRQRAKLKELNIAQGELDAVTGTLTELKAQSSALFEANLNLQQEELAQKRARENAIFAQQIKDGDINSTDPYIREVGIRNAVTRIIGDIPTTIPLEQHIANAVASSNPQEYLAQLTKDIQGKDLYKAKQAYAMRQYATPTEKAMEYGFANLGNGMIAVTDPKTGNVTFKNATGTNASGTPVAVTSSSQKGTDLLNTPEGTVIPSRLSQTTNPNGGKECGEYVNDIAGSSLFGDTIEQKMSVAEEDTGAIGKAIVWKPSNSGNFAKYGHVGVIIGQNADGSWKVKSSNLKGDGAISIDNVPQSVALGYKALPGVSVASQPSGDIANLGQFMKDNQELGPGYSDTDAKKFDAKIDRLVKAGDEEGMAIAYRSMIMKDKDFKEKFDQTQEFTNALDNVQALINDYENAGKSTSALKAMAEKMYRSLGITQDQALAQLQTQMGFTLANYIKSISGTAASDAEVQRLMGNMANIGNVSELNTTIVNQVRDNAQSGLRKMIDTRMYGMPENLKPKVFGDIYGQTITPQSTNTTVDSDFDALYNSL